MKSCFYFLFGAVILISCAKKELLPQSADPAIDAHGGLSTNTISQPVDVSATTETRNLYLNLQVLAQKGVMFGHEEDMATGITWHFVDNRSDIKELCGYYPSVFGTTLGQLEVDSVHNLEWTPFWRVTKYAREAYDMRGINTFAWHCNNPVDPTKNCLSTAVDSTIKKVFADTAIMARYKTWLDKVAAFVTSQKGPNGELIPIIFRPFHEFNGNWYWWGKSHCTAQEYIDFWRLTVDYLRVTKGVHNLLYAFCPDKFYSRAEYLERYPGDDYVDVLSFDSYDNPTANKTPGTTFVSQTQNMITTLRQLGLEKDKPIALTETGSKLVTVSNWWTQDLLPVIKNSGLSFALIWENNSSINYWGPYIGHPSAPDFLTFVADSSVIMQNKLYPENVYQAPPSLLEQDFSSSSTLTDYVSTDPTNKQFSSIGSTGAGTTVSISSGALKFDRTANANSGYYSRVKDFYPLPSIVKYKFDITVSSNTSGSTQNQVAVFQIGSGFVTTNNALTGTPIENNALIHSRFGITFGATAGQFAVRDISGAVNSSMFSGTQTITWVVNNSTKAISYTAPNGMPESLGIDKADLWIGTTRIFNETSSLTPSQTLSDLKFAFTSGLGIISIDNIKISRL
jgi:mannan endo-1,4-beta-mannosidase